jgi:protein MpaA
VPAEHLHDTGGPDETRIRADEDELDAGPNEEVDERLRKAAVDVRCRARCALAPVEARVVEIDIEAVLMRRVPGAERAAVRPTQIADADPRSTRMKRCVALDDAQDQADEVVSPPPAPAAVRPAVQQRVPGEERRPAGRKLDATEETAGRRAAEGGRVTPADRRRRPCEAAFGRERAHEPTEDERETDQAKCAHSPRTRTRRLPVPVSGSMGIEILLSALALVSSGPTRSAETFGHSAEGRVLHAYRLGNPESPETVLVVGCIHGNETAGIAITRKLLRRAPPSDFDLWIVNSVNPDGQRLHGRQNGRGVDLNRNFPSEWVTIGTRWDPEYSGPYPWSEPETRAVRRLVLQIEPDITIWYHQPQTIVRAWGQSLAAGRRYARFSGMIFRRIHWPNGTAPNWQNHRFPGTSSFVVELPPGPISERRAARQATAVFRLARSFLVGAREARAARLRSRLGPVEGRRP